MTLAVSCTVSVSDIWQPPKGQADTGDNQCDSNSTCVIFSPALRDSPLKEQSLIDVTFSGVESHPLLFQLLLQVLQQHIFEIRVPQPDELLYFRRDLRADPQ